MNTVVENRVVIDRIVLQMSYAKEHTKFHCNFTTTGSDYSHYVMLLVARPINSM